MRQWKPDPNAAKPFVPARARIVEAAWGLFRFGGIRAVRISMIAEQANTNIETVVKYFSREELINNYVRQLAKDDEWTWGNLKNEIPGNAAGQLRNWLEMQGTNATDRMGCALSNVAIELIHKRSNPAREVIREQKEVRLGHIARLCREAGYREPELLANKLNLLIEGRTCPR